MPLGLLAGLSVMNYKERAKVNKSSEGALPAWSPNWNVYEQSSLVLLVFIVRVSHGFSLTIAIASNRNKAPPLFPPCEWGLG